MVANQDRPLRPLRLTRPGGRGLPDPDLRQLLDPVPARVLAPDWSPATEDNGAATPRGELHVALLAPDATTAAAWRAKARVITPPLWKGGVVRLHVITINPEQHGDPAVLMALVDLGLIDPKDAGIVGYPSGLAST